MKNFNHIISLFVLVLLLCFAIAQNAYAYLDPGSGSYILQIIIAALLGGLFAVKVFWVKIKEFFKNLFSK